LIQAFWWGGVAAASLLVGYLLAERGFSERNLGLVMGFGAGALIAAIAYELVPESMLTGPSMAFGFLLGALAFFAADAAVDRRGGSDRKALSGHGQSSSGAAIFVGTVLDAVPESVILGMNLAVGSAVNVAFLAAVIVSNLPEGVAGTASLEAAGYPRGGILRLWGLAVLVSAAAAAAGYYLAVTVPSVDGRFAQAFAAGAMLTMLADAMMPEAFRHGGQLAGISTVLGFLTAATLSVAG
jgi:ZIP family zinc transporter